MKQPILHLHILHMFSKQVARGSNHSGRLKKYLMGVLWHLAFRADVVYDVTLVMFKKSNLKASTILYRA